MTVFQQQSVVAVVPARGGSKGVPLKNIHPLLGRPLIAHVGELVQRLPWLDRAVVSTDHPEIAAAAEAAGLAVPFTGPRNYPATGSVTGRFAHALAAVEQIDGRTYDVVVMLQPTSPLRTPQHVTATVRKLVEEKWDAVWTVSPTDLKYHPLKQLCLEEDGAMRLHIGRAAGSSPGSVDADLSPQWRGVRVLAPVHHGAAHRYAGATLRSSRHGADDQHRRRAGFPAGRATDGCSILPGRGRR